MEYQDYLFVGAVFFLAAGTGFAAHNMLKGGDSGYVEELSLRADTENSKVNTTFDGNFIELRHEEAPEARFYFNFNQSTPAQEIENFKHDGTLQTTTEIKSFGNKTYFLYIRYRDDPNQSEDAFIELFRIEET